MVLELERESGQVLAMELVQDLVMVLAKEEGLVLVGVNVELWDRVHQLYLRLYNGRSSSYCQHECNQN